ncbi:MAG: hypothetical protein KDD47_00435, partial [Acidobacteria bacterium]|nr:hypothetical protein [Acidobacteriota bacterium]
FGAEDVTAGTETELATAVLGGRGRVDLPLSLEASNYFGNVARRAAAGELPSSTLTDLERFLDSNPGGAWENSWVRFDRWRLSPLAESVLRSDLRGSSGQWRSDTGRFLFEEAGEEKVRVPVSYLLKLSLAAAVEGAPKPLQQAARRIMPSFLSDNTSPETTSFHVITPSSGSTTGEALAKEGARRYLLTQLLVEFANRRFGLLESGQRVVVYQSPLAAPRQRWLNRCLSDAFYREQFLSPCLSGWKDGEGKRDYMELCHQVLSRSQLQLLAKLREAGLVPNDLVVLPSPSNVSLANNGVHITLGSRRLQELREAPGSGFGANEEKGLADLVVKIAEHYLPLLVGTFSGAPYRLGFEDFHPERALGFLPHELDFTHLRMIWRRWRVKARNRLFGKSVTPFGPAFLDRGLGRFFGLKGDLVPDFRLIDYPVALLSTEKSPALDGNRGNGDRLKKDLGELGVFDSRMSLYLPLRWRELESHGYVGLEGRTHSLFPDLLGDAAAAADLQRWLISFALRRVAAGVGHDHIPDFPWVESERRQILFATALGVPTFYVRQDSPNRILQGLVTATDGVRRSSRYPGYLRVPTSKYLEALAMDLRHRDPALSELHPPHLLETLEQRVRCPRESASGRLATEICEELGARDPLKVDAATFNEGAETYYRGTLRRRHLDQGFEAALEAVSRAALPREAQERLEVVRKELRSGGVTPANLRLGIHIVLEAEEAERRRSLPR